MNEKELRIEKLKEEIRELEKVTKLEKLEDNGLFDFLDTIEIEGKIANLVYAKYSLWATENDQPLMTKNALTRAITSKYGFNTELKSVGGKTQRVYI